MASAKAERTDEELIDLARDYNVGDVALGMKNPRTGRIWQRGDIANRNSLRSNVFPGTVINRSNPTANYQFLWIPFNDSDAFGDAKDDGFAVVTKGEWILNREGWEWYTPEKSRFRWSVSNMLCNRDEFLMYRNEDRWLAEQKKRLQIQEDETNARHEGAVDQAARAASAIGGIEIEANIGGKRVTVS